MLGCTEGDGAAPAHARSRERVSVGKPRVTGDELETSLEKERTQGLVLPLWIDG